jgi:hypothetical protein
VAAAAVAVARQRKDVAHADPWLLASLMASKLDKFVIISFFKGWLESKRTRNLDEFSSANVVVWCVRVLCQG